MNPFIGASPDWIVECSNDVLEIKCPFSCKDKKFDETTQE